MYINSIEISNFRSIGSNPPLKLDISDITVLSGINDTGKTSALLASFIGLNSVIQGGKNLSELMIGSSHRKGYVLENSTQIVKVSFKCSEEDTENIFKFLNQSEDLKPFLEMYKAQGIDFKGDKINEFIRNAVITMTIPLTGKGLPRPYIDYIDFTSWNNYVWSFFGGEHNYYVSDFLYKTIDNISGLERAVKNMNCLYVPGVTRSHEQILITEEDRKSQLVTFFKEICSEQGKIRGDYFKFKRYFKILLPELESFEINISEGNEKAEDIFFTWKTNDTEKYQPLSRSGDGIYNAIFLVAKVLNNFDAMNIVFIDEPEIGLHPMLQQRFIKLLRKLSREFPIQWVLATHSPFILQSLKDKEKLYLIKHDGDQTNCQDIDIDNKGLVFSTLGAYLPLALSATGIIFVEGQTEVTVLTLLLDRVGLNIERERILIIPLGGENLFQIAAKDLKKLHEKSMVIIDSDLSKPEEEGGNIKKIKLDYQAECEENNVEFLMIKDYRTLENMYPKDVLADVLGKEVETLDYGNFDEVPGIRNKIKVGEEVANKMSKEEAKRFPLIKEIQKWWNEK